MGFPGGTKGKEPALSCKGRWFDPWFGSTPHAAEQRSPCATTTDPVSRIQEPQQLSPCAATTVAHAPRACAPPQERPQQ